jgi:hypothetical protein
MARKADTAGGIDQIIRAAVEGVIERATGAIQEAIATSVAAELRRSGASVRGRPVAAAPRRRRAAQKELTKWVADRRARRVPNFVIAMTGLETKKKIVARYGANVAFEVGKPPPPTVATSKAAGASAHLVRRGAGPVIRRASSKTAKTTAATA